MKIKHIRHDTPSLFLLIVLLYFGDAIGKVKIQIGKDKYLVKMYSNTTHIFLSRKPDFEPCFANAHCQENNEEC